MASKRYEVAKQIEVVEASATLIIDYLIFKDSQTCYSNTPASRWQPDLKSSVRFNLVSI